MEGHDWTAVLDDIEGALDRFESALTTGTEVDISQLSLSAQSSAIPAALELRAAGLQARAVALIDTHVEVMARLKDGIRAANRSAQDRHSDFFDRRA